MLSLSDLLPTDRVISVDEVVERLQSVPLEDRLRFAQEFLEYHQQSRMTGDLMHYKPVSEAAKKIHYSTKKIALAVGGNRSSKTDTNLADLVIMMTGRVPPSLPGYPKKKLQPPIRARLVCESLTNTWATVIRPKLQWNQWNGRGERGGPNGHWGWIPRDFLIHGKWEDSWSEKERTLTLVNGSTLQVMSYDQDVQDFSGSSFHVIYHDEGPPHDIWRENTMRTVDTDGLLRIGFTPPDDDSTSWKAAWIYDEIYEPGTRGHPSIDVFELFTLDNRILDADSIHEVTAGLSEKQKQVRLYGRFIHLSGRIYPTYADTPKQWCFECNDTCFAVGGVCATCKSPNIVQFCHLIEPFQAAYKWPAVFTLDPHPRKPHMMSWFTISPSDDVFQVAELEVDGEPEEVRKRVDDMERALGLNVVRRLMDPNMAGSPQGVAAGKRGRSVRDAFDEVGIRCALADDNRDTARARFRSYLKPDPRTKEPRFHLFNTCPRTDWQLRHYIWDEHATAATAAKKDPKPTPREKEDDFPCMIGYLMNDNPSYAALQGARSVLRHPGRQRQMRAERLRAYA